MYTLPGSHFPNAPCSQSPMFTSSISMNSLIPNSPMFPKSFIHRFCIRALLGSYVPYVPIVPCFQGSDVPHCSVFPMVLCSPGSYVSMDLCSQSPMFTSSIYVLSLGLMVPRSYLPQCSMFPRSYVDQLYICALLGSYVTKVLCSLMSSLPQYPMFQRSYVPNVNDIGPWERKYALVLRMHLWYSVQFPQFASITIQI